jgi:L-ribulose-5-phosphate 3-epimerase
MDRTLDRRRFLGVAAGSGLGLLGPLSGCAGRPANGTGRPEPADLPAAGGRPVPFHISLAQWSLHRALRQGWLRHLDFARKARSFGIEAVEYVNSFFKDRARDMAFLGEMQARCAGEGVKSLLIMCDGEGALGDPDAGRRRTAVQNHHRWVEAAAFLGCHSIRVNAQSSGSFQEQQKLAADGLRALCTFADGHGISVLVENHGGLSSHGGWLSGTLKLVDHPRIGALPDFGNFKISATEEYDRYQGVAELMPFARAVSAKSHDFDANGAEVHTDYRRMLKIVLAAGYRGFVGIEYEGARLSEEQGIVATRDLLRKLQAELA